MRNRHGPPPLGTTRFFLTLTLAINKEKKERNFAICSNMDGLGGRYAKGSKSDRERQMLHDITYV